MSLLTRRSFVAALPSLMAPICARAQDAENYPIRAVTVIVPYAAGGGLDLVARVLAQKLSERTGQSFFVENRLGAGGVIAANAVAKAIPDGYTILTGSSTQLAIQVTLHKTLPYDPATDFVPIALVASVPFVLIVHPSLPVQTAGDLIKLAKERPGQLSFGSSGIGGPPHLYMELMQTMTGTQMTHIPVQGNIPGDRGRHRRPRTNPHVRCCSGGTADQGRHRAGTRRVIDDAGRHLAGYTAHLRERCPRV